MTAPLWLPVFFTLVGTGWLLGRHWDHIISVLLELLGPAAPATTARSLPAARPTVVLLRQPYDQDGGDAA